MCRKQSKWLVLKDMKSLDTESTVINTLLEKGIGLVKLASPSLFMPRNSTTAGVAKKLKPLKISFVSSHVHKLSLNNTVNAITYLSLPATEYSVLDSSLVSRSEECNDTFVLNIPLGDISSMYSYGISSSPRLKLDTTLSTSVEVKPEPANSLVRMRSTELFFINNKKNNNSTHSLTHSPLTYSLTADSHTYIGTVSNSSAFIGEALPVWLIDNQTISTSDAAAPSEGNELVEVRVKSKSSIQTGFEVQLSWKERQRSVDALDVSCKVKVWFDVNVPLPEDITSVLSLPPIRLIVAQLGSLLVKVFLRTLAPTFGDLLVKDYQTRFKTQDAVSDSVSE